MRIDVRDAERRGIGRIEVDPARRPTRVRLEDTGRDVFLDWDTALDDAHRLRRCVVCGCNDLFKAKAFPQITGFVVVLAFAGAIVGALQLVDTLTLIAMVVVLVADVSILLFTRQRLVCHRCRSSYHGLPIARYHRRWDRAVAERHAPPPKPVRLLGGRRPRLRWPRRAPRPAARERTVA
ncbi:MAG: hypothetical protein ACYSU7_04065 [Planctomycetota bacterium]|jgi:hypothetical protein